MEPNDRIRSFVESVANSMKADVADTSWGSAAKKPDSEGADAGAAGTGESVNESERGSGWCEFCSTEVPVDEDGRCTLCGNEVKEIISQ